MSALELAVLFHVIYERKSAEFNYVTRQDTRIFDPESPNGKLMIAVCDEIMREDVFVELAQLRNDNVKLNKLSQTQTESIAESTKYILQLRTENTRLQKAVDTARYILIDVDTYEDKNSPVIEDEVKAWLDSNKETK